MPVRLFVFFFYYYLILYLNVELKRSTHTVHKNIIRLYYCDYFLINI